MYMPVNFFKKIENTINDSINTKKALIEKCAASIESIGNELANSIKNGGKIMFCGNGGSAADSQHLAAELVVRLRGSVNRRALPAIALTVDTSILTAGGNDYGFNSVFARQVEAFGKPEDILICISTSGNSPNVLLAAKQAKEIGMKTIGMLGGNGGELLDFCDQSLLVPSSITARIQECHITVGHIWCEMIEEILFPELF